MPLNSQVVGSHEYNCEAKRQQFQLYYRVAIEKMHMHVMIVQIHSSTSLEEGSGLAQELPATLSKSSHPPHNYLKRLLPVHFLQHA